MTLVYTHPRAQEGATFELQNTGQQPQPAICKTLTPSDISGLGSSSVTNQSTVSGSTVTDALNTLGSRKANYFDATDSPVGLWQFNSTLAAAIGPNFTVGAGTAIGFTEVSPGFVGVTAAPGVRLQCAADPALQLVGDMSFALQFMLEDVDAGMVLASHGGTGGTAPSNKLYEFTIPSAAYPRNWGVNWESGVAVPQAFATPTAALSPSTPPVHVIMTMHWVRQGNIWTPYLNGKLFSAASGVTTAPAGGGSGFLTLFADALNTNISFWVACSAAVYNRSLSAAEVLAQYNRALGGFWGIRT